MFTVLCSGWENLISEGLLGRVLVKGLLSSDLFEMVSKVLVKALGLKEVEGRVMLGT